jgi:hypothetical protein
LWVKVSRHDTRMGERENELECTVALGVGNTGWRIESTGLGDL